MEKFLLYFWPKILVLFMLFYMPWSGARFGVTISARRFWQLKRYRAIPEQLASGEQPPAASGERIPSKRSLTLPSWTKWFPTVGRELRVASPGLKRRVWLCNLQACDYMAGYYQKQLRAWPCQSANPLSGRVSKSFTSIYKTRNQLGC